MFSPFLNFAGEKSNFVEFAETNSQKKTADFAGLSVIAIIEDKLTKNDL